MQEPDIRDTAVGRQKTWKLQYGARRLTVGRVEGRWGGGRAGKPGSAAAVPRGCTRSRRCRRTRCGCRPPLWLPGPRGPPRHPQPVCRLPWVPPGRGSATHVSVDNIARGTPPMDA